MSHICDGAQHQLRESIRVRGEKSINRKVPRPELLGRDGENSSNGDLGLFFSASFAAAHCEGS